MADCPLLIAHRGASARAPENTLASILAAIDMGAACIEFDVRATRDGHLVLFHDAKLDRITGHAGAVESLDLAALDALDAGRWFADGRFAGQRMPKLREAIALCRDNHVTPLIEHKTGQPELYAAILRELNVERQVILQSFDWPFLAQLRRISPQTPIGALGQGAISPDAVARLHALTPDMVAWKHTDLAPTDLTALRGAAANSPRLAVWTVNDPVVAKAWTDAGIDAIITDTPDMLFASQ